MKTPLNVFFSVGKYFITYFTVSLTSLLENNRHLNLNIFLIYDFDTELLNEVKEFAYNNYGVTINLIYQDSSIFDTYRIGDHVSKNTYLRLLIANLIPASVSIGLFLDSDTVVSGPLDELIAIKFESGRSIFAVREIEEQSIANSKRLTALGYKTDKYFNAGVLLIDLKAWRENHITDKLMLIAEKHMTDLVFWDQDVLNMFFLNNWGELDPTFNALHLIWKRKKKPLIIHYVGASKPWNYLNRHPYRREYFKYLNLTPYRYLKYTDQSWRYTPYKYYREFRHFLNYFRLKILHKL